MEVKFLKEEKNEVQVELNNLTVAEILRVYLNNDESVSLAVWKREHPSKNPVLTIKTKGKTARKALSDAAEKIEKDADKIVSDFKTSKTK